MPLCKPQQMSASEVCTLCGQCADYGDSQDAKCPFELPENPSDASMLAAAIFLLACICLAVGLGGLMYYAAAISMGAL